MTLANITDKAGSGDETYNVLEVNHGQAIYP